MVTNQTDSVIEWVNKVGLEVREKGKGNKIHFKELRRIYRSYSPRSTLTQIEFTEALVLALGTRRSANYMIEVNTLPYELGRRSIKAKHGQTYVDEKRELYPAKEGVGMSIDLIATHEVALTGTNKGVKKFKDGGFATHTTIGGISTVIYTAKTEAECAAAYNRYLKIVQPLQWKHNLNKVDENLANVDNLLQILILIGDPKTKRVAESFQKKIKKLLQKVDS